MITAAVVFFALWLAGWLVARAVRWKPKPVRPPAMRPSVQRKIRDDAPHVLYQYERPALPGLGWYYGISNEPAARHRRRATDPRDQWWYQQSTRQMVILERFPNRQAALAAERAAILAAVQRGDDIANTQHVPRWYRQAQAARNRQEAR